MIIQKQFEKFNNKIRLDYENNVTLTEKRDILIKILHESDKIPTFIKIDQGSYAMHTGINPKREREYDIDVGLRFKVNKEDYNPMDIKKAIAEILKNHTEYGSKIKKPCVKPWSCYGPSICK